MNYVMMYTFRQAMHYLTSVATLALITYTITIRVYGVVGGAIEQGVAEH